MLGKVRELSGSGSAGQSVVTSGEKLVFLVFTLPPTEQMRPALSVASFFEEMPDLLVEFDCTRQPGAVSNADFSRLMVAGADGSRPSRHSGRLPFIRAVERTLTAIPPRWASEPITGATVFLRMTCTVEASRLTLVVMVTASINALTKFSATAVIFAGSARAI